MPLAQGLFFALRAGLVISCKTLFQQLVGRYYGGLDRAIGLCINRLLKYLQQLKAQGLAIVIVLGLGYLF
ncbi:hypothetical protein EMM73_02350 [Rheinheimera sediminis]|nr:hypothetical protein EMM73_02350 [Rheinheimera sp. YQF-1]